MKPLPRAQALGPSACHQESVPGIAISISVYTLTQRPRFVNTVPGAFAQWEQEKATAPQLSDATF